MDQKLGLLPFFRETPIGGKIQEKFFGAQISGKRAKIRSETRFFCHFLKFDSLVFLEIVYTDSFQQCITSSRGQVGQKKISY